MATFTSRTVNSTRREWIVPAAPPWGAAHAEVHKAFEAAEVAYREARGLAEDTPLSDDALWVTVGDEEIIISFTTEVPA